MSTGYMGRTDRLVSICGLLSESLDAVDVRETSDVFLFGESLP